MDNRRLDTFVGRVCFHEVDGAFVVWCVFVELTSLCICWDSLAVMYVGVSKSNMGFPRSFSYFSLYFTWWWKALLENLSSGQFVDRDQFKDSLFFLIDTLYPTGCHLCHLKEFPSVFQIQNFFCCCPGVKKCHCYMRGIITICVQSKEMKESL